MICEIRRIADIEVEFKFVTGSINLTSCRSRSIITDLVTVRDLQLGALFQLGTVSR